MSKLARANALADEWAWEKEQSDYSSAICSHFNKATPHQLIEMWKSGKNLEGRSLSQFEFGALVEAWCRVFREMPPDDDDSDQGPAPPEPSAPEPEMPADDTMLSTRDVVRQTGVSKSTITLGAVAAGAPASNALFRIRSRLCCGAM